MSSPVYNVSVDGNSNDTDLMIQSAGSTITDNAAHHPIPSHSHLETSINELKKSVEDLSKPKLLLRKKVYQRNEGFEGGQTIILENLNTYISDYTNQRPFIGKITGSVYATQRYEMGGFKADVCYLGGQNTFIPRVEYANITSFANARYGLGDITIESEIPDIADRPLPTGPDDLVEIQTGKNGTLTINMNNNGQGTNLDHRYNVYVSIFIQIDTLLEFQDLPTFSDPSVEILNDENGIPPERREKRAILNDYVSPSLLEKNENAVKLPLDIQNSNNVKVKLYTRYKVDYLKNKILDNQYWKFLPVNRWKTNSDVFIYKVETENADYFISACSDIKDTKNVLLNLYEDSFHNQGSSGYDTVINPYFHSGNVGHCLPPAIGSGLTTAQTGLTNVTVVPRYRSGNAKQTFDSKSSWSTFDNWIWENLLILKLTHKDLHIIASSINIGLVLNLIPEFKGRGISVKTVVNIGSGNLTFNPEIAKNIVNRTIGFNPDNKGSAYFWSVLNIVGGGLSYIANDPVLKNMTLQEYYEGPLAEQNGSFFADGLAVSLIFVFFLWTYGVEDGLLTDYAKNRLNAQFERTLYGGASIDQYIALSTDMSGINFSNTIRQEWMDQLSYNPATAQDVRVVDYFGKWIKNVYINLDDQNLRTALKEIKYIATTSVKVGDDIDGVPYYTDPNNKTIEDSLELIKSIFGEDAEVLKPSSLLAQDINFINTNPEAINQTMLKFAESVLKI